MTKRMWFIVAGTIAMAACGSNPVSCETPGFTTGENRGRDNTNVACSDTQPEQPTAPAPTIIP